MSEALPPSPTTEFVSSVTESTEKVERIREILFGAHMREAAQKLDSTKHEALRLQQEIGRLHAQLEEQEQTLRQQMREETDQLRAQLQEQGKRQTQLLQATEQRHLQHLQDLDQQHRQHMQQLSEQIQHSERTMLDQLRQLSSQLNHAKADRNTLGALLIELGTNLKSNAPAPLTKVTDLLEQLSEELA